MKLMVQDEKDQDQLEKLKIFLKTFRVVFTKDNRNPVYAIWDDTSVSKPVTTPIRRNDYIAIEDVLREMGVVIDDS